MNLQELQMIVNDLNSTNSTNIKRDKLAKHSSNDELKKLLGIVYSPYKRFLISGKTYALKAPYVDPNDTIPESITSLLELLSTGEYRGDKGISMVKAFIEANKEYELLIISALDKNLKIRMNAGSINRALPNTVEEFSVALGLPFDDKTERETTKGDWYISRKLDGCRVITIIDEKGDINFYSRQGNEFHTLEVLKKQLEKMNLPKSSVLEGEVYILDSNGDEDFKRTVSEIKKKDHVISHPVYSLFDYLTLEDFKAKKTSVKFSQRLSHLHELISSSPNPFIEILPQYHKTDDMFKTLKQQSLDKGWEGLMLRKDAPYQGKRSKDILKYKLFTDDEYQVVSRSVGTMRVIVNGKEVEEEVMTNVTILHKGNPVDVGSGFKLSERRLYKDNPNLIIGKLITVQYFEETHDKDGKLSLRFPTFKALHGETREL